MAYLTDDNGKTKNYIFGSGNVEQFSKENNIEYLGCLPIEAKLSANSDHGKFSIEDNKTAYQLCKNILNKFNH